MQLRKEIKKKISYYSLRADDILISSFPKVGSTFTRFVLANLVNLQYQVTDKVNFHNLNSIMPELGHENMKKPWEYSSYPRFVKTHDRFNSKFKKVANILYIIRDPRDTMISYHSYANARKSMNAPVDFNDFVLDKKHGMPALNKHFEKYFDHTALIFKYEDLMTKPVECFDQFLNDLLKLNIADDVIEKAVALSRPERVKKEEEETGRPTASKFNSQYKFIRNAGINQWQEEMDPLVAELIMKNTSQLFLQLGYK